MIVVAIILGIALGFGLAFMIAGFIVNSSANKGDSKGKINDFASEGVVILEKQDKIKKDLHVSDFM